MIAVVDYGMGNLRSVHKALERAGGDACVTQDAKTVAGADGLVLPGVGAFRKAMENLGELKLIEPIRDYIRSDRPFLGICLGLQLLFTAGEEFGVHPGLGIFPGRVVRFPFTRTAAAGVSQSLKVPHMGWNSIRVRKPAPVLEGIPTGTYFYFVHSYYPVPEDSALTATSTDYGGEFVSSISRGNLFACQFHPEKSQSAGQKLLQNFRRLVER